MADGTIFLKILARTDPALAKEVERRFFGVRGMQARRDTDRESKLSLSEVADLVERYHDRTSGNG